jgi:predicted HTH transcriptional regulator
MKKKIHENSMLAYHDNANKTKLSLRKRMILGWLFANESGTDRQIKDALFGETADMNKVRPRISDLIKAGRVIEIGSKKDDLTGKLVRVVALPESEMRR